MVQIQYLKYLYVLMSVEFLSNPIQIEVENCSRKTYVFPFELKSLSCERRSFFNNGESLSCNF